MNNISKKGFSIVEALIVLVVVVLVGFLGWALYQNLQSDQPNDETLTTTETSSGSSAVPEVNNESDLRETEKFLNETDIDGDLDASAIDKALAE